MKTTLPTLIILTLISLSSYSQVENFNLVLDGTTKFDNSINHKFLYFTEEGKPFLNTNKIPMEINHLTILT